MTSNTFLADLPLAGDAGRHRLRGLVGPSSGPSSATHSHDGHVGSRLLSADPASPGLGDPAGPRRTLARAPARAGLFLDRDQRRPEPPAHPDGTTREVSYQAGETRYFHFGAGEFLLHDIENVGDNDSIFTTVEHLDSENAPLDLSDGTLT